MRFAIEEGALVFYHNGERTRIEAEWGAELFLRGQSGLRLTEAGHIYLDAAGRMADLYQQMRQEVGETTARTQGQITLGITLLQGGILLPTFLSLYRRRFPEMKLTVVENTSVQLEEMILAGQADLAILHSPVNDYRLSCDPLYREDFYLAVPTFSREHAAAGGGIPIISSKSIIQTAAYHAHPQPAGPSGIRHHLHSRRDQSQNFIHHIQPCDRSGHDFPGPGYNLCSQKFRSLFCQQLSGVLFPLSPGMERRVDFSDGVRPETHLLPRPVLI